MQKTPRKKKCKAPDCQNWFYPQSTWHKACSTNCALEVARADERRKKKKELRKAKERLKTRSDWLRDAQTAFNAYIRQRDVDDYCISCDLPPTERPNTWDCGHYRTVGACPELRFEPLNAHKQCKSCNSGVRRNRTRITVALDPERHETIKSRYREKLIEKIGLARVEWLEGPHKPKRYRIEDLKEIRAEYRRKLRNLKARQPASEPLASRIPLTD